MGVVTRAVSTDTPTDILAGRFAVAGTDTYTNIAVGIDFHRSEFDDTLEVVQGAAAYVDTDDFLLAGSWRREDADDKLIVVASIGGVRADLEEIDARILDETWYSLRLQADEAGRWAVWLHKRDARPGEPIVGQHSALATGGALATRKRAFYDYCGVPGD